MRRFRIYLAVLAVLITGLMALGAGVRTMNAGLSCPDWPLCFGKVIPDFHIGVWFEFVHRAYAGIVALLFAGAVVYALRSAAVPARAKTAAKWGALFLTLQIVMGGLTVLLLVKAVVVTAHLLLATLFLGSVLWMLFAVHASIRAADPAASVPLAVAPKWQMVFAALPWLVFAQIAVGGLVASTYAGSVCVDWPLCNGEWVPTWQGAIGLQIVHRFFAYALVLLFIGIAIAAWRMRLGLRRWTMAGAIVVAAQAIVGILNLLLFIPPSITVPHQTLALVLLAVTLKLRFETTRSASRREYRVVASGAL